MADEFYSESEEEEEFQLDGTDGEIPREDKGLPEKEKEERVPKKKKTVRFEEKAFGPKKEKKGSKGEEVRWLKERREEEKLKKMEAELGKKRTVGEKKEEENEDEEEVEIQEKPKPKRKKSGRVVRRKKRLKKRKEDSKPLEDDSSSSGESDSDNQIISQIAKEDIISLTLKSTKRKKKKKKSRIPGTPELEVEVVDSLVERYQPSKLHRPAGLFVENHQADKNFKRVKNVKDLFFGKRKKGIEKETDFTETEKLISMYKKFPTYIDKFFNTFTYFSTGLAAGLAIWFLIDSYITVTGVTVNGWLIFYKYKWFILQPLYQIVGTSWFVIAWYFLVTKYKDSSKLNRLMLVVEFIMFILIYLMTLMTIVCADYISVDTEDFVPEEDFKYFVFYSFQVVNGIRTITLVLCFVVETLKQFVVTSTNITKPTEN